MTEKQIIAKDDYNNPIGKSIDELLDISDFNHFLNDENYESREIDHELAANELFLFSILTERIKAAKAIWKRGKVRLNSNF
jgi:hypothetical protein